MKKKKTGFIVYCANIATIVSCILTTIGAVQITYWTIVVSPVIQNHQPTKDTVFQFHSRVDTVFHSRVDTVFQSRVDTVIILRIDTVRLQTKESLEEEMDREIDEMWRRNRNLLEDTPN